MCLSLRSHLLAEQLRQASNHWLQGELLLVLLLVLALGAALHVELSRNGIWLRSLLPRPPDALSGQHDGLRTK